MINVQYPFLDLTSTLLGLLQKLNEKDWKKTTILYNHKVSSLANHLLLIYIESLTQADKELTFGFPDFDTKIEFSVVEQQLKTLEQLVLNSPKHDEVSEKKYAYCWLLQQFIHQR